MFSFVPSSSIIALAVVKTGLETKKRRRRYRENIIFGPESPPGSNSGIIVQKSDARPFSVEIWDGLVKCIQALPIRAERGKVLAEKVNTSASYITQLFRGDRLTNFNILAKIQRALGLTFEITGKEAHSQNTKNEFDFPEIETDYGFYGIYKNLKPDYGRSIDRFKAEYNEGKVA